MVWKHTLSPTILEFFGIEIRWYGLMYVLAFLAVYFYVKWRIKNKKVDMTEEELDSLMVWTTIGLMLGAKLFEILFYDLNYYLQNPLRMLEIWQGLSFHGGLFGITLATILWTRKNKKSFWQIADAFTVPLALGQAFGRLGNFFNAELYGYKTSLPWAVDFGDGIPRHPTQIYELLYNLIIFAVLLRYKDKLGKEGRILGLFLIMYSIFRTLTEFFRYQESSWVVGPFTVAQLLNIPLLLFGIWLLKR